MAAMRMSRLLVVLLLGSLLLATPFLGVRAQEEEEEAEAASGGFEGAAGGGTEVVASGEDVEEAEEEVALEAAKGVETSVVFPGFIGKSPVVRAGQKTELLFGISNEGSAPLKIAAVISHLYVTYDYSMRAQNFTGEAPSNVTFINATVPAGAQSSFSYYFTPFKMIQPMTLGFASVVYYEMEGRPHASVLFNSTIEIIEPAGVISGETVFLVLFGAGVLVLLGMWVSNQLETISKRAKRNKKVETGTGDDSSATNEWLQGTFFNANQGKAQASKIKKRR